MNDSEYSSPYRGILVTLFFILIVPIICNGVLLEVLERWRPHHLNELTARALGFGIGSVMHLSMIIQGLLEVPFRAVISRIGEFFQNIVISPGLAFSEYWRDIKTKGLVFWIYAIAIGGCFYVCIDAVIKILARLAM